MDCASLLWIAISYGYRPWNSEPQVLAIPYSVTQRLTRQQRITALNCAAQRRITFRIKHGE